MLVGVVGTLVVCSSALAVTILVRPPAYTNQPNATFSFSGADSYACELDHATSYTGCTNPLYLTGLSEGQHTLKVVDSTQQVPTPATYTWTEDFTPPDTELTQQPPAITNQTTATFAFASSDPTATFECSLNGAALSACTSPVTYSGLNPGAHEFAVHAIDPAGNVDVNGQTVTWTVDTTPPTTTMTGGPAVVVGGTASDPRVRADDITPGQLEKTNSTTASFTLSSSKSNSTFQCSLDGAPFAPCSSRPSLTGLSDGSHVFSARAVDAAGNVDPNPPSLAWKVKATPPPAPVVTLSDAPAAASKPGLRRPLISGFGRHRAGRRGRHRVRARDRRRAAGDAAAPLGPFTPPTILTPVAVPARTTLGAFTIAARALLEWSDTDASVSKYLVTEAVYLGDSQIGQGVSIPAAPAGGAVVSLSEGTDCFTVVAVDSYGNTSPETTACTTRVLGWTTITAPDCGNGQYGSGVTNACTDSPYGGVWWNFGDEPLTTAAPGFYDGGYAQLTASNADERTEWVSTGLYGCDVQGPGDLGEGSTTACGPYTSSLASPVAAVALVATTCPTCGSVRVEFAFGDVTGSEQLLHPVSPTYSHVVDVRSGGTSHSRLFVLPAPQGATTNRLIWIIATSGKPKIEGIGWYSPAHPPYSVKLINNPQLGPEGAIIAGSDLRRGSGR